MNTSNEAYWRAWTSGLLDSIDKRVIHILTYMGPQTTNELVKELEDKLGKRISDRQISSSTSRLQKSGVLTVEEVVVQSNGYKARKYKLKDFK